MMSYFYYSLFRIIKGQRQISLGNDIGDENSAAGRMTILLRPTRLPLYFLLILQDACSFSTTKYIVSQDWMQLPRTAGFRALILYSHVILEGLNTHIFNDALLVLFSIAEHRKK